MRDTNCDVSQFDSGLVCLHTTSSGSNSLAASLSKEATTGQFGFALIFFCKTQCDPKDIVSLMAETAPDLNYASCSTAGELTPDGLDDGQIIMMLFPAEHFSFHAHQLETDADGGIDSIASRVSGLKTNFSKTLPDGNTAFALCLLDGTSFMEEAIVAAIHWGLEELHLLGGSAGDNLKFESTILILNGEIFRSGGIIIFVGTNLPIEVFKTDNFVPSKQKLVVTRSDPEKRIVHELNAAPAALTYAEHIGTDPHSLNPQSFASHPLVMRVGGEYYCRSIQKVNPDNSLSFFCAIDDGVVLTVAEQTGMARSTQRALEDIDERLQGIDFVLGFDCMLRKLDARNRQITHRISSIYQKHNVLGFNTYGEQYRSMHLNQTLTGVAFGKKAEAPSDA